jgi:hypothetical protein
MQRVPVGRTLLIAGVCALIPLAGNVAASFLTEWTGGRSWLVVPVVGVGVAMVTALIQAYGKGAPVPAGHPPPAAHQPLPYPRPERRGTPLPVAVLIIVLVIGVGGWAITEGVRYAVGYITGNESGTERLRRPASATADGLTLTVESVEHTRHFTRVRLAAQNDGANALTLPLFKNANLIGADGTTLEANPFKSRWSDNVAPGSLQRGTITFDSHLPDSVRRAALSFTTIFSMPSGSFGQPPDFGPGSIKVSGIRLRPP